MPTAPSWEQQLRALTGPQRSAVVLLDNMFRSYGLGGLAGRILTLVKEGASAETITSMLESTPEYKERFKANDIRLKNGYPALSPKEYLEVERSYASVMRNSGMPKGFHDSRADWVKFIGADMSPSELQERVTTWIDVAKGDSRTVSEMQRLYGMDANHYAAYLMDPQRAAPLLKKQAQAIQFAGAARRHGFTISRSTADAYGQNLGVDAEKAQAGWAAISEVQPKTAELGTIYGDTYSVEDAAAEMFGGSAHAADKRKKIASKERATFSGSSRGSTGKSKDSSY